MKLRNLKVGAVASIAATGAGASSAASAITITQTLEPISELGRLLEPIPNAAEVLRRENAARNSLPKAARPAIYFAVSSLTKERGLGHPKNGTTGLKLKELQEKPVLDRPPGQNERLARPKKLDSIEPKQPYVTQRTKP